MSYTLRIYSANPASPTDTEFDDLLSLYDSIFDGFDPSFPQTMTVKAGVNLAYGFAVFDNDRDVCINSKNAAQVGYTKEDPLQPEGPSTKTA
jgi:hypothetical protein